MKKLPAFLKKYLWDVDFNSLDFFTDQEFSTEMVLKQLGELPGFKLSETAKWTILGSFPKVKFSYFYYRYPLVNKTSLFSKMRRSKSFLPSKQKN